MRPPRPLLALAAAAVVLPVAGCGNSDKGLLTSHQANRLDHSLEAARRAADANHCSTARSEARAGAERASRLGRNVTIKLQRNLQNGFNHLVDTINADCGKDERSTPTPTPSATPSPTPTATSTSTPSPSPTPTPTPTPSPTPSPTTTATPTDTPDTGGTGSGDPVRQVGDNLGN